MASSIISPFPSNFPETCLSADPDRLGGDDDGIAAEIAKLRPLLTAAPMTLSAACTSAESEYQCYFRFFHLFEPINYKFLARPTTVAFEET